MFLPRCLSVRGGGISGTRFLPGGGMSGTHHLLLTISGGHHSFGRQASGAYPTEMLSCYF